MSKIIFFDIDGTIFNPETQRISDKVKKAIKNAQNNNYLCFIASGRPYSFIASNVKDIGFDGYLLSNGAVIIHNDKIINSKYLNKELVYNLINFFDNQHFEYILSSTKKAYLKKEFKHLLAFYNTCNIEVEYFINEYNLDDIVNDFVKIEVWYKDKKFENNIEQLKGNSYIMFHDEGCICEISPHSCSKGSAIKDICKTLNIDINNTYCFGDGENDIDMFETVKYPIAMGNAISKLKEISYDICDNVYHDGVASKLDEIIRRSK